MSIEQDLGEILRAVIREELAATSSGGDDQLLTADEVAAFLALENRHSVYALKRSGKLRAVTLGDKSIRFRRGAVRAFIQEREN